MGEGDFRPLFGGSVLPSDMGVVDLPATRPPESTPSLSTCWVHLPDRVPASLGRCALVQDYPPACHRLRL